MTRLMQGQSMDAPDEWPLTPERLCARYAPRVYPFAALVAAGDVEAEDLAQDAMVLAIRNLGRFDTRRGSVETWLWRIVVNAAIDAGRVSTRRRRLWERFRSQPATAENVEDLALMGHDRAAIWRGTRFCGCRGGLRYQPGGGDHGDPASPRYPTHPSEGDEMSTSLEDRLTELELRMPDTLLPRILGHAAQTSEREVRSVRRRPRWATVALAIGLLIAVVSGASFYAPRFAQALADAPIVGTAIGPALRSAGLAGLQGRFTVLDSRATSSGYAVRLVAGYADNNQTVLVLRVDPPDHNAFGRIQLTDQFGRTIAFSGGMSDARTGNNVLIFQALPWPDSSLGARLRLHISTLEAAGGNQPVAGDWTLQGTISVEPSRALPLPAAGMLGDSTVRF